MKEKIDKKNIAEIVALNKVQSGMLFHYLKEDGANLYNVQLCLLIRGELEVQNLLKAFELLQLHHEVLRSVFRWEETSTPVQIILKELTPEIVFKDFSSQEENADHLADEYILADRDRRFELTHAAWRCSLLKSGTTEYYLIFSHHHILYDGWSTSILVEDLFEHYYHLQNGTDPGPIAKLTYKDVMKLRRKADPGAEKYWRHYLEGYMPVGLADPWGTDKHAQGQSQINISRQLLTSFSAMHHVTAAAVIYAATGILLQKYLDTDDIVVGVTVSNRDSSVAGFDRIAGNFINTLPLRCKTTDVLCVKDAVRNVQNDLLAKDRFQHTSYAEIKQWLAIRPSEDLFDSLIVIENYPVAGGLFNESGNLNVSLHSTYENTGIPLVITVFFREKVEICLRCSGPGMDDGYAGKMAFHLQTILEEMLQNESRQVMSLSFPGEEERRRVLYDFNNTGTPYPAEKSLIHLFEEQVQRTPYNTAVITPSEKLTYSQLNSRANGIASYLQEKVHMRKGALVGIMLERDEYLIPCIFGILKTGAAYVPIDPHFPSGRINAIIKEAGITVLLTRNIFLDASPKDSVKVIDLDQINKEISIQQGFSPLTPPDGMSLAYVLFTSGSTGNPKGVMIRHHSVINRLLWMQKAYPLAQKDVLLQKTPIVFDVSVWELFWWSLTGASLCLLKPGAEKDPHEIINAIRLHEVTTIHFVPSMLSAFLQSIGPSFDYQQIGSLRQVFASGEALKWGHVHSFGQLLHKNCGTRLINLYGPTEATVDVSYYECNFHESGTNIPIGKPIDNIRLYILNSKRQPVPEGVAGELCIAGVGVAAGYVNNGQLTDEKFVVMPTVQEELVYLTGDMARWRHDGNIEFLGRRDDQVKIRGYRIECGEIEKKLGEHPAIKEAVVICNQKGEDKFLVAYYVSDAPVDIDALKRHLQLSLPLYMVPAYFVFLPSLPVNANGKLDKKLLPSPVNLSMVPGTMVQGNIPEKIADVWREILGHNNFGANSNFFDVGGDSLKLIALSSKIKKVFDRYLTVSELLNYPTITAQADVIGVAVSDVPSVEGISEPVEGSHPGEGRIAIIGMSCRMPGVEGEGGFWEALREGRELITREEVEDGESGWVKAKGKLGGYEYFDGGFFGYSRSEVESMDPQVRLFHEGVWEALENAGYDPYRYGGRIGLYGGASLSPYYNIEVNGHDDGEMFEKWAMQSYSDKDFICSRVSYRLNLRGPSISISTACSTSLVAVDMACSDLMLGKCGMAVAGGVSVTLHDEQGYKYHKGMILSADGRCRVFDEQSSGTVGGNGMGLVVLKRLEDAIRDGDEILAVILGSATNNDGNGKVGYTAPGIKGQSAVIREALRRSGVEAESISYVEAHGTGTALGDPVEISGLKEGFGTGKRQYCAIGSVKSNIGHLDVAAGIAGLIKTVLSLRHGEIPASLHYRKGNGNIDFAGSPFYVNAELSRWERGKHPRRAGVSSFGIGGTNAHVVLEEWEQPESGDEQRGEKRYELLVVSGRTQKSLKDNMRKLSGYLGGEEGKSRRLCDIGYTLQSGRGEFGWRRAVVAGDHREGAELLAEEMGELVEVKGKRPVVVFMFPGQGSQYHNMCRGLYEGEVYFRQELDSCFGIVKELRGYDMREVIYGEQEDKRLHQTEYTQPALFCVEYALSRLLMKWGIEPEIVIGHSIGEYVAGCLSGVFTLQEALKLVCKRGALMEEILQGMEHILGRSEELVLVEVGPGNVLSSFVRNNAWKSAGHRVVSVVRHVEQQVEDSRWMLKGIGEMWMSGVGIKWEEMRQDRCRRVRMPGYSFERERYAVRRGPQVSGAMHQEEAGKEPLQRNNDITQWFYTPTWKSAPKIAGRDQRVKGNCYLVLDDNTGIAAGVARQLAEENKQCILVRKGTAFVEGEKEYVLDPEKFEHYGELFLQLNSRNLVPDNIIYAWSLNEKDHDRQDMDDLYKNHPAGLYYLLHLVKAANDHEHLINLHIVLLTNNGYNVAGNETVHSCGAALPALLKIISQEYAGITTCAIDIAQQEPVTAGFQQSLFNTICHAQSGAVIALRNNRIWEQCFEKLSIDQPCSGGLRTHGVYMITGGLGQMGYTLARYLMQQYEAKIILTGRTVLQPSDHRKTGIAKKIQWLDDLEKMPGEVIYLPGDVSVQADLLEIVSLAEKKFGKINGIIHAAGIVAGNSVDLLSKLRTGDFEMQLKSKVAGLYNLRKVLGDREPDFCLIASSVSTILGGIRFGAYTSANAVMDHYVNCLKDLEPAANWMSVNFDGIAYDDRQGEGITSSELCQVFEQLVDLRNIAQVIVSVGDLHRRLNKWVYKKQGPVISSADRQRRVAELFKETIAGVFG